MALGFSTNRDLYRGEGDENSLSKISTPFLNQHKYYDTRWFKTILLQQKGMSS